MASSDGVAAPEQLPRDHVARLPDGPARPVRCSIVVPVKDEDVQRICDIINTKWDIPYSLQASVELIVVDDGSQVPVQLYKEGIEVLRHETPQGYGAALKHGMEVARGDYVLTADGDGQHSARDVQRLIEFLQDFPECDMVIGDRRVVETSRQRYWGRKFLNWTATLFCGRWIPDLNSGLRAFRRHIALGYEPILCNGFSFTTSLAMAFLADGYRVDWMPIRVLPRAQGQSHVKVWQDGWVTLRYIIWIGLALRTRWLRRHLRPLWSWVR